MSHSARPLWYQRDVRARVEPAVLRRGLDRLGPEFAAALCFLCHGTATYRASQCTACEGFGLHVACRPVHPSVAEQVLNAGEVRHG